MYIKLYVFKVVVLHLTSKQSFLDFGLNAYCLNWPEYFFSYSDIFT